MKKYISLLALSCTMSFMSGQTNRALAFDGTNDEVSFFNQPLKDAENFTIEAMILNENPDPDTDVFMQFYDDVDTRFELRFDQGKLALYSQQLGISNLYLSSFAVPVGKYFHLALVKQGAITRMYVNYEPVLTVHGAYSLGKTLRLGRYFVHDVYSFKGKLDELRMWNVAKTAAQIKYAPKCGLKGNETNLAGYWNFDEGLAYGDNQGVTILPDLTANHNEGTLNNFALTGSTSNWVSSGTGCNEREDGNNALSFDGSDDQVFFAQQPLQEASNFTIDAMILNENPNPNADVIMQFHDDVDTRFELRFDQGKLALYNQQLDYYNLYISSFTVPVGVYFHLALVKNGAITKLYVDNKEVLSVGGDYSLGKTLRLGRYFTYDVFSFKGKIDELRMWDIAKTPDQLKYTRKCGLTGNESHLVGYWSFNEGTAYADNIGMVTLQDGTPYNNDGTLYDFALTGTSSNWVASGTGCVEVAMGQQSVDRVLDLNDDLKASGLSLYPNPATTWIEIEGAASDAVVQIHDVAGKLLLEQKVSGKIMLPAALQAGTYVVSVKGEKTSKFVLVKE